MENLIKLRRKILSDERITEQEADFLEEVLYDNDGMTRAKADFLFDLKDIVVSKGFWYTKKFKDLFIKSITIYLLEDENSPCEIDESEARWLYSKIHTRNNSRDIINEELLENLKIKSINFPEMLNKKSKGKRGIEKILIKWRKSAYLAVVGSLISAAVLFVIGVFIILKSLLSFIKNINFDFSTLTIEADYQKWLIVPFITSVDIFLFAMVLYVFGIGTYELFINKLDSVNKYIYANPKWLSVSSIDDLKHHLGKVILMILFVYFFKFAIQIKYNEPMDLLFLALGILFMSGALFIANYHHKSK